MAVCGVIQADVKHNKIIAVNKEALRLLGTDAAGLETRLFGREAATGVPDLSGIGEMMQNAEENEHTRFSQVLNFDDRYMSIEGAVDYIMEDKSFRVVQFTFLDNTERELLRQAETKLEIATKSSQAKSYFLSKMSHEIRTPLNGIVGMIDSAMLYRHDKEKLQDCLNKLKRSSLHLSLIHI